MVLPARRRLDSPPSGRRTAHGLAHAQAEGYAWCVTDWRTTTLTASRLRPRLGFRPYEYRLARLIDEHIAWAPGVGGQAAYGG